MSARRGDTHSEPRRLCAWERGAQDGCRHTAAGAPGPDDWRPRLKASGSRTQMGPVLLGGGAQPWLWAATLAAGSACGGTQAPASENPSWCILTFLPIHVY